MAIVSQFASQPAIEIAVLKLKSIEMDC
jgi:hypothetical protein